MFTFLKEAGMGTNAAFRASKLAAPQVKMQKQTSSPKNRTPQVKRAKSQSPTPAQTKRKCIKKMEKTKQTKNKSKLQRKAISTKLKDWNQNFQTLEKQIKKLGLSKKKLGLSVKNILQNNIKSNTRNVYKSNVKSLIKVFPNEDLEKLIPCDTPVKLMLLFTENCENKQWKTTKGQEAAISKWHLEHGWGREYDDSRYSQHFQLFWKGLKRASRHDDFSKRAITHNEFLNFQKTVGTKYGKKGGTSKSRLLLAFSALAFYGVKRVSEVANLQLEDVIEVPGGLRVVIKEQKQGGKTTCFIPTSCPGYTDIKSWISLDCDSKSPKDFVFTKSRGKARGSKFTAADFRDAVDKVFKNETNVSTHSFRKGGAQHLQNMGASKGDVKKQGGWATEATMDAIYLALSKEQTEQKLVKLFKSKLKKTRK